MLFQVFIHTLIALSVLDVETVLGQTILLNNSFKIQGKRKCSDPLLPLLLADSSKKYFGCCTIKPKSAEDTYNVCCLLAGSSCDPFGENAPPPCRGAPCCGKDGSSDSKLSFVRLTAGTVFEPNLRQRDYTSVVFSPDRDPMVVLNKDPTFFFPCEDPKRSINKRAVFHKVKLQGCCTKEPTTPQETGKPMHYFNSLIAYNTCQQLPNAAWSAGHNAMERFLAATTLLALSASVHRMSAPSRTRT